MPDGLGNFRSVISRQIWEIDEFLTGLTDNKRRRDFGASSDNVLVLTLHRAGRGPSLKFQARVAEFLRVLQERQSVYRPVFSARLPTSSWKNLDAR